MFYIVYATYKLRELLLSLPIVLLTLPTPVKLHFAWIPTPFPFPSKFSLVPPYLVPFVLRHPPTHPTPSPHRPSSIHTKEGPSSSDLDMEEVEEKPSIFKSWHGGSSVVRGNENHGSTMTTMMINTRMWW